MIHRGPFQPLAFCDSVSLLPDSSASFTIFKLIFLSLLSVFMFFILDSRN